MSDAKTIQHNMNIIIGEKQKAIKNMNDAITQILYCTTTDELHNTAIETKLDKIGLKLVHLKRELESVKIVSK